MSGFTESLKKGRIFLRNNWLYLLTAPVSRCPGLFLCIATMLGVMPLVICANVHARNVGEFFADYFFTVLAEPVVAAWAMLSVYLVLRLWENWIGKVWLTLCFIFSACCFLLDYVVRTVYHVQFKDDIAAVLCATDASEGLNFIVSYVTPEVYGGIILYSLAFVAAWLIGRYGGTWLKQRMARKKTMIRIIALAVIVTACTFCFVKGKDGAQRSKISYKVKVFARLDNGHELVPVNPKLVTEPGVGPTKLVVIIGESHCRSHSSLYGYERQTQPEQERLAADSTLYVFRNAVAPATNTIACFKRFIGTWNGDERRRWYEQFSFLEAARLSGYRLMWFSNQSNKGVYDNPVVKIAGFCDVTEYTNDGMNGILSGSIDWKIYDIIDRHFNAGKREFIVLHLMGCHSTFRFRYPKSFDRFKPFNYPELPETQRKTTAEYDNAVLYNDHVLSEIYRRYAATDAVILYFSDHALDFYQTTPDYAGHAVENNPSSVKAGTAIPFTIYLTDGYRARHPLMARRIADASRSGVTVHTTDIIYTLMDIMGTRFADNDDVADRSILK